jgi:putative ABC transport system permease protein
MFRNNFKIAWRNFLKDRQFSLLNLLGLSTGLACAILIYLWSTDELHIDKFNEKDDQLFQVLQNTKTENGVETIDRTPGLLAKTLATETPEVEYAASVIPVSWFNKKGIIANENKMISVNAQFAGKDFFNIFSYRLIEGDKNYLLSDKYSVVISKKTAVELFNTTENILGKTLIWNQKDYTGTYSVSGVFENPPANATTQFDIIFSYELFLEKNKKLENWENSDPDTYVILKKGAHIDRFNGKIAGIIKGKNNNSRSTLFAQKYSDRYLYDRYENGLPVGGRIEYVRLLSAIAIFILLIACINFMNLSTAKASGRLKESGIKKVMGANRMSLVTQYIGESVLMTLIASIAALVIVFFLLPQFNHVTTKQLRFPIDKNFFLIVAGIALFIGILSGSYPALYLSGFKPAITLKGKINGSTGELLARKGLVIFQFIISAMFIVTVLVVYKQMQLIQTKNLGYDRNNIIYFEKGGIQSDNKDEYKEGGKYEMDLAHFMNGLKNIPGVVNVSNFRHNITNRNGGTSDLSWEGKDPNTHIDFTNLAAGYNFIETLGIEMKEGRSFSNTYGSEKNAIIFNEAAIEVMGIKNPVGKLVHLWGEDRKIIGVTKNFNFQSLYQNLKPCFFDFKINQWASKIMVKIKAGKESETIEQIRQFYKEYNHGFPFEYRFLNDDYQALYESEKRVTELSKYFAALAIIISCLGLFGLAAFTAQRRQKEISIRKIIGASAQHLFILLTKDFLKLVLIAILVAFPLSWWILNQWLHSFAYRINIGSSIFLAAGFSIILITLITISFQSIKAATATPIKSLRLE